MRYFLAVLMGKAAMLVLKILMIEEIVKIFEKYGIDTGACHDYC